MTEKVSGFYKNKVAMAGLPKSGFDTYLVGKHKIVPVVLRKEYKAKIKELEKEIQFKEDRISNLIVERDKGLWQKSISLEQLNTLRKKLATMEGKDKRTTLQEKFAYCDALDDIFKEAKKEADQK